MTGLKLPCSSVHPRGALLGLVLDARSGNLGPYKIVETDDKESQFSHLEWGEESLPSLPHDTQEDEMPRMSDLDELRASNTY